MRKAVLLVSLLTASLAVVQSAQNHPYISVDQANAIANEWTRPMDPFQIRPSVTEFSDNSIARLFLRFGGEAALELS